MGGLKDECWRYQTMKRGNGNIVTVFGLVLSLLLASRPFSQVGYAQDPPKAPNLAGDWHWSSVGYSGRLRITQNVGGTFSGAFVDYGGTIEEGRIQGNQITFVRRFAWTDGTQ